MILDQFIELTNVILIEPQNSIIKQYKKLFEIDSVELSVEKKVYTLKENCLKKRQI